MSDLTEAGKRAGRRLLRLLDDVDFPASREDVVRAFGEAELEIEPGNVVHPGRVLAEVPVQTFGDPVEVARALVEAGAIRAGGRSTTASEENAMPGHQAADTSYESAHHTEPPTGEDDHATAPPPGPGELKGVRRPQS